MANRFLGHRFAVCKTVRPMLSDRCLSCLSVTLVYCGQTVGWMPLGWEHGYKIKRHFSAYVYCGQTAGWMKMRLRMVVGLGPGDIMLDGELGTQQSQLPLKRVYTLAPPSSLPPKGGRAPNFRPMSIVAERSPISATASTC